MQFLKKRSKKNISPRQLKKNRYKIIFLSFCLVFIFAATIGLLIWQSNHLLIKQISIQQNYGQGDRLVSEQEIKDLIEKMMSERFLFVLRRNTLLTLNSGRVRRNLLNDPRIQSVQIQKKWPDQLAINIQEHAPVAILSIIGDKDYLLNSGGEPITAQFDILRHLDKPFIIDKTNLCWQGSQLSGAVKIALELLQDKSDLNDLIKFRFVEISLNQGNLELNSTTNEGWIAKFTAGDNIEKEIDNLKLVLENQLAGDKRKGLEYVDLRFGDKVYYK